MIRLFVALALPDGVSARLGQMILPIPDTRTVLPEDMHITLRFIGEVDEGTASDIDHALARIRFPAFDVSVAGAGLFGSTAPRILWAGVDHNAPLITLQKKISSALMHFDPEGCHRRYTPHISLIHLNRRAHNQLRLQQILDHLGPLRLPPFRARAFHLFRSLMVSEGPRYQTVASYPLDESLDASQMSM